MISLRAVAVLVFLTATASAEGVAAPASFLERVIADARVRIDAAIAARPPVLVPPKKIAVKWRLAKVGSIDLGAPLVALAGGKAELYAVTPKEVVAIGVSSKKLVELGRVALTGEQAVPAPRDVVASAIVDRDSVLVSVSRFAKSFRLSWLDKALVATPGDAGFVMCAGEIATLTPGRNYFGDRYTSRCVLLVDAEGRALFVRGDVSLANKLTVTAGTQTFEYSNAGVAIELADVDRDGTPEAMFAGAGAPGEPDVLKVISLGGDEKKPKLKKAFTAGGIAGIATVNGEVIVAVRLLGASRVDLWRIE